MSDLWSVGRRVNVGAVFVLGNAVLLSCWSYLITHSSGGLSLLWLIFFQKPCHPVCYVGQILRHTNKYTHSLSRYMIELQSMYSVNVKSCKLIAIYEYGQRVFVFHQWEARRLQGEVSPVALSFYAKNEVS